jgi:hypothetical protein
MSYGKNDEIEEFIKKNELEMKKLDVIRTGKIAYKSMHNNIVNNSDHNIWNAIPPVKESLKKIETMLDQLNNEEKKLEYISIRNKILIDKVNKYNNKTKILEYICLFFYFCIFILMLNFEFDKITKLTWRKNLILIFILIGINKLFKMKL